MSKDQSNDGFPGISTSEQRCDLTVGDQTSVRKIRKSDHLHHQESEFINEENDVLKTSTSTSFQELILIRTSGADEEKQLNKILFLL